MIDVAGGDIDVMATESIENVAAITKTDRERWCILRALLSFCLRRAMADDYERDIYARALRSINP
jgi:hypothetical protein